MTLIERIGAARIAVSDAQDALMDVVRSAPVGTIFRGQKARSEGVDVSSFVVIEPGWVATPADLELVATGEQTRQAVRLRVVKVWREWGPMNVVFEPSDPEAP